MYTREHCLYKKLHNTWNTKKSLINRVRLSFKILKHKYWIIKKKMRQFNIQKEERKNTKQTKLFKSIFLFKPKDSSVLSVLLTLPSWFECMPQSIPLLNLPFPSMENNKSALEAMSCFTLRWKSSSSHLSVFNKLKGNYFFNKTK